MTRRQRPGRRAVEQRVAELENLLRPSLRRDPRIRFDSLRDFRSHSALGSRAAGEPGSRARSGPTSSPRRRARWAGFSAAADGGRTRLRRPSRHSPPRQADCQRREAARQRGIAAARAQWARTADEARRQADAHNAEVAETKAGFRGARPVRCQQVRAERCWTGFPTRKGSPPSGTPGTCPSRRCWRSNGSCRPSTSSRGYKAFKHVKAAQGRRARRPAASGGAAALHCGDRPGRGPHGPRGIRRHPAGHGQHGGLQRARQHRRPGHRAEHPAAAHLDARHQGKVRRAGARPSSTSTRSPPSEGTSTPPSPSIPRK